jgi:hypothetical protein
LLFLVLAETKEVQDDAVCFGAGAPVRPDRRDQVRRSPVVEEEDPLSKMMGEQRDAARVGTNARLVSLHRAQATWMMMSPTRQSVVARYNVHAKPGRAIEIDEAKSLGHDCRRL